MPARTSKLHAEIEDILTTLKSLDAEELATQALSSKLHKDKSGLSNNAHVQAFIASHPTQNIDGTSVAAKAQNRILANKVVVQCMQEVIESLRQKAGIASAAKSKQKESAKSAKQNSKSALTAQNLAKVATSSAGKGKAAAKPEKDDDETSSEEDSDIEEGSSGTASHISAEESLPDDEFEGIQKGEEDESEEDAEDDQDDDAGSISGASTSSFPVVSKQKEPIVDTAKSKKQRTAETSPPTTSAFLPSLAAGYTLGDSDGSVYSDDEAADTKPQRKNRRGQRARQA